MKPALTFLLALAAAAQAQFAVMHTNGVVTSPSNLTIQQSNVAGLSNALAGKLDTNGSAAALTNFPTLNQNVTVNGNVTVSGTVFGAAAPVLQNPSSLMAAYGEFMYLDRATKTNPYYVGLTGFGDSMATTAYSWGEFVLTLADAWGIGGLTSPNLGGIAPNGAAWTFAGGAAIQTTNFTETPGGNWILMPSNSSAVYTLNPNVATIGSSAGLAARRSRQYPNYLPLPYGISKVSVFYVQKTNSGTLEITLSQNQHSDQTVTVDCNTNAATLGRTDFVPSDWVRPTTLTLSNSGTNPVTVVGAIYYTPTGGIIPWSSALGGTTMQQQLAALANTNTAFNSVYSNFFGQLNTALVYHAQRVPGDTNWQSNYNTFFSAFSNLNSNRVSQIVVSEPPRSDVQSPLVEDINAFLRQSAKTNNIAFIDTDALVGTSYAKLAGLGFDVTVLPSTVDGVHLGGPFYRYFAGALARELNWFRSSQPKLDRYSGWRFEPTSIEAMYEKAVPEHTSRQISLMGGFSPWAAATNGNGYTNTSSNERGFQLTGGATNGYITARLFPVSATTTIQSQSRDFVLTARGYRNVSLASGHRAALLIGGPDANVASLTNLTNRTFGIEIARASDVGNPETNSIIGHAFRLFAVTSSNTVYSAWSGLRENISGAYSSFGYSASVRWDRALGRLFLTLAHGNSLDFETGVRNHASLEVAEFKTNSPGQWIHMLVESDGVTTPTNASAFSFSDFSARWGCFVMPIDNP